MLSKDMKVEDGKEVIKEQIDLNVFGISLTDKWWKEGEVQEHITLISMGNPHVVFICQDPYKVPLEKVGPKIENHFAIPVNVHFASFSENKSHATVRTWERGGNGISLACGTGVSAVCVAGIL